MVVINQSYDVLSDPERRKQHDAWIRSQELKPAAQNSESAPRDSASRRGAGILMPQKGSVLFKDLTEAAKGKLRARVRDQRTDQDRIPLTSIRGNYFWAISLLSWVAYVFYEATQTRWDEGTSSLYMASLISAGIFLANNLKSIHAWHYKPLRPSLIVTPLYVIQTDAERAWYWPLTEVKDFNATHHLRNGAYQYTAVSVSLGGENKNFSFSPQRAYSDFVGRVSHYLEMLQQVAIRSEQTYVDAHDDFKGSHQSKPPGALRSGGKAVATWASAAVVSLGLFSIANAINKDRPAAIRPAYSQSAPERAVAPAYSSSGPVDSGVRSVERTDHIKARLGGELPPERAGYIPNEEKLNTDGLSTVTVDNSQNESDVLVKLVYTEGDSAYPVRVFFIPARGKFTVSDVRAGNYDIRYLDRWNGGISKSEPFELEEIDTGNGTQYSAITMTLFKVQNGNMQTYTIDPEEF